MDASSQHSELLSTIKEESALLADWAEEGGMQNVDVDNVRSRLMAAAEDLVEQLEAAQAENKMLRMWLCTDGAHARGLAQSMTELPTAVSLEGIEENSRRIVELLNIEQRLGFPSASTPAKEPDA